MNLLHALVCREKQGAMHLRSDFGEVQPEVAAKGGPKRLNLLLQATDLGSTRATNAAGSKMALSMAL